MTEFLFGDAIASCRQKLFMFASPDLLAAEQVCCLQCTVGMFWVLDGGWVQCGSGPGLHCPVQTLHRCTLTSHYCSTQTQMTASDNGDTVQSHILDFDNLTK